MEKLRKAAWAGQFYPSDPTQLKAQIKEFLDLLPGPGPKSKPLGLIVPHAGYIYSGPTAAAGFKLLLGNNYNTIVVLAPSHAAYFEGISIYNGDKYETPLGTISVDKQIAELLCQQAPVFRLSNDGHDNTSARPEHSLEVQLPFLQAVLENFKIVPIIFHDFSFKTCQTLGQALGAVCSEKDTLVVASSDLYHGYSYKECQRMDNQTLLAIQKMDAKNFLKGIHKKTYQACGAGPIAALIETMKVWGKDRIDKIAQTNSADVSGQIGDWTVGYASLVVY